MIRIRPRVGWCSCGLVLSLLVLGSASSAQAFDPSYEARNYAKINERAESDYTPQFDAQLAQQGAENEAQGAEILATDGPQDPNGRDPTGNLCFHHMNGCAGDIRLYAWGTKGYGDVMPVLFTQRNGATLSGHVWMTRAGPDKRPGIVITNGSIQAPEPLYWYAAQTLAKDGYIVLTFDPQGQGYSDTYGEGADRNDGVPSQNGGPFFFGTEDALDFFFSAPQHPYVPRPSCSTGTSHEAKQQARVAAGLDSAYNPFWSHLDTAHVGLAGHSLGAAAVSYIGQLDPRVKAIVAWDNLSDVTASGNLSNFGQTISCPSGSSKWPATLPVKKPALGMSDDYGLTPMPFTPATVPAPASKNAGSLALTTAGVDSGELSVRGGTHYEFSYIPNQAFGATHRGMDMADWYTLAWFDKYLKHDPTADARLTTNRWCDDAAEKAVDDQAPPDGDMFSTYLTSRLDIHADSGAAFDVEDMRAACQSATHLTPDPWPANFSFLAYANTPDSAATPGATTNPAGATGTPPAGRQACGKPSGRLAGRSLGPVTLGMTRARARRRFARYSTRGRRYMDFFCQAGRNGIRAGYPSPKLLRRLSRAERRRVRGRVVLVLTASRHYALRGVRPGARLAAVARRLAVGKGFHIGLNWWYLAPGGSRRAVLKVRHGIIEEIGIADKQLTNNRRADSRFLRSFG